MSITNHLRRSVGGKIAVAAMTVALLGASSVPAFADTATGTGTASASVPINGTINPTTISITVPNSISYSINPDSNTFTAPSLAVTNNTKDYFKGKQPEHMDLFMNKKKHVSAIIRRAVKRGEIEFLYQPAFTPEDK